MPHPIWLLPIAYRPLLVPTLPLARCGEHVIRRVWHHPIGDAFRSSFKLAEPVIEIGSKRDGDQSTYPSRVDCVGVGREADRATFRRLHFGRTLACR